jgi:outer membrane lipopolysaccharide assembly protein LptE/RlpB
MFVTEQTLYVEPVKNDINITDMRRAYSQYQSYPLLVEKKLTNALVKELNTRSPFRVIDEEDASFTLACAIVDYTKETLRYSDTDNITEQRLRLHVKAKLLDQEDEVVKEDVVVGDVTYFLSGPYATSDTQALKELVEDTSRRIIETVSERWLW